MTGPEPAAIRFTLECLQKSTRRSGIFSLLFSCIYIQADSLSLSTPRRTKWILEHVEQFQVLKQLLIKENSKVVLQKPQDTWN